MRQLRMVASMSAVNTFSALSTFLALCVGLASGGFFPESVLQEFSSRDYRCDVTDSILTISYYNNFTDRFTLKVNAMGDATTIWCSVYEFRPTSCADTVVPFELTAASTLVLKDCDFKSATLQLVAFDIMRQFKGVSELEGSIL